MKLIKIVGVSLAAMFVMGTANAADQSSFAVLSGAQAEVLSHESMDSTYGKHFTIILPNGNEVEHGSPAGNSNGNANSFGHALLTLGGGAAELSGLPCAVCEHH
jgi:hypothetical protein